MRNNEELSISQALNNMFDELHLIDEVKEYRVKAVWKTLFGSTFDKYLTKMIYKKKVLILYISSATLRHEMFLQRTKIKQRLNEELEEALIKKVILR